MASPAQSETAAEQGGFVKGASIAIVTQNDDPEGLGRVKLKFPWHEGGESEWARVAVPMASDGYGSFFLPEVNDEVLVLFDRGDMRFPYVVGALWSGKAKPPADNGDKKNDLRIIKTRKGHHLSFNDGAKGEIDLKLDDGKRVTIDDDGIRADDGQGNSITIDSKSGEISITAAATLKLSAPSVSIEATGSLNLKAGGTAAMKAAMIQLN